MSARPIYARDNIAAYHASWADLLTVVQDAGGCDALIVDAPYSERTHAGAYETEGNARQAADGGQRRALDYAAWSAADVGAFVAAWAPLVRGWFVSITDDVLAPAWRDAYDGAGLCTFPILPCITRGSGVRLQGDGPSSVTTFAVVARVRSRAMAKWGTLPGFYDNNRESMPIVGGKPLSLMRALVRDYARPGDLVVDPCAGAFTTGLACKMEGRRFIGGDAMEAHAQLGAERLRELPTADRKGTLALFGGAR